MNNFSLVLSEMLGVADHPIVKTRAHSKQNIAVLHGIVSFYGAVHAQHAQKLTVACRVGAQAHQGVCAGVAEHVNQGSQFGRGIAQQNTATGIDIGAPGCQQQLQRLANLPAMALADRVVGAHFNGVRLAGIRCLFKRHILRDINHNRTGAAAARDMKSFFHDARHVAHVFDQKIVLDYRACDAHCVALLKSI